MRLIDADKLDFSFDRRVFSDYDEGWTNGADAAIDVVNSAPAVDAARMIEMLHAELEQVKLERDAMEEHLHGKCSACFNYTPNHNEGPCRFCCYEICRESDCEVTDNWKWRGAKEH